MNSNVRLDKILSRYPDLENIISMYDIDIEDERVLALTIEEFCEHSSIDLEDFLMDIEEAIEESRNTAWLSNNGEDQWAENFTEEEDQDNSSNEFNNGLDDSEDHYSVDY
ncbi:MAG: hypothetical protein VX278_22200 [Myxococcota bacterium]|nr:hypothetical protein [Myxococcota bacterium]